MSRGKFNNILKEKIRQRSLEYLSNMRGSKGKYIEYTNLEMAQYLLPNNSKITIVDKKLLFSIKNRMVKISDNFRGKMT